MKPNDSVLTTLFSSLFALAVVLALLAGCGSDPASPEGGAAPPMKVNVVYPPVLYPQSYVPAGGEATQSLAVYIFEVTDNPFVRTAALFADEVEPVVADTSDIDVPTGAVAFLDTTYDLDVGEETGDFRVYIEKFTGIARRGSRTINDLAAGETRDVDIYLTPSTPPGEDEHGLQLVETWATSGATEHLVPVVLVNADSVGGLQFDLSLEGGLLDGVNGIVVDGGSRLYLDADSSSVTETAENEVGQGTAWRVLAFSGVGQPAIEPGYAVVLYLSVDIGANAATDTLQLSGVVISGPGGETVPSENVEVLDAVLHVDEL